MDTWQLQDAKARLSEVVKRAAQVGPQRITLHGRPAAVLLSTEAYERLGRRGEADGFIAFMRGSPLVGVDLDLSREDSAPREPGLDFE